MYDGRGEWYDCVQYLCVHYMSCCSSIAGGDHSGGALNGEVLLLLNGVTVTTIVVVAVAAVVVLDGIAVGELWCLSQCSLVKACLCLLVNGFGLLLLGLRLFGLGFARFCGWKNAEWASRSQYLFAFMLFGVLVGFFIKVFW